MVTLSIVSSSLESTFCQNAITVDIDGLIETRFGWSRLIYTVSTQNECITGRNILGPFFH
jgi:hypothetical protein